MTDIQINIGPEYQCTVPELIEKHTNNTDSLNDNNNSSAVDNSTGTLLYSYQQYCQSNNTTLHNQFTDKKLDEYLNTIYKLFNYEATHFNEWNALKILHGCNYDMKLVKQLLKPLKPVDDDELDANNNVINLTADDICCVCTDGGDMIICDDTQCHKVYHPGCVMLEKIPDGTWHCTYHTCTICGTVNYNKQYYCTFCPTSYCAQHIPTQLIEQLHNIQIYEFCCTQCAAKHIEQYNTDPKQYSAKRMFLKRLLNLLKREGKRILKIPRVNYMELNLYALYIAVINNGGIVNVVNNNKMLDIARQLKLTHKTDTEYNNTLSELLIQHYMNILYLYEKIYYSGWVEAPEKLHSIRLQFDRDDDGNLDLTEQQMKHALQQPIYNSNIRDDNPNDVITAFVPRPKIKRIRNNNTSDMDTVAVVQPSKPLIHTGKLVDERHSVSGTKRRGRPPNAVKQGMLAMAGTKKRKKSVSIPVSVKHDAAA